MLFANLLSCVALATFASAAAHSEGFSQHPKKAMQKRSGGSFVNIWLPESFKSLCSSGGTWETACSAYATKYHYPAIEYGCSYDNDEHNSASVYCGIGSNSNENEVDATPALISGGEYSVVSK